MATFIAVNVKSFDIKAIRIEIYSEHAFPNIERKVHVRYIGSKIENYYSEMLFSNRALSLVSWSVEAMSVTRHMPSENPGISNSTQLLLAKWHLAPWTFFKLNNFPQENYSFRGRPTIGPVVCDTIFASISKDKDFCSHATDLNTTMWNYLEDHNF